MDLICPWPLRRWIPVRPTVRLRLALLYGSLFLVSGTALLGVTYLLVDNATSNVLLLQTKNGETVLFGNSKNHAIGMAQLRTGKSGSFDVVQGVGTAHSGSGGIASSTKPASDPGVVRVPIPGLAPGQAPTPKQAEAQMSLLRRQAIDQHNNEMHQLLLKSGIALAGAAVLSAILGWLLAGRALRPIKRMTATAKEISSTNLRQRLALEGPDDELKELGDTFDQLLERLDRSFDAQRQFVANASHELRTPLARQRTLLEVGLDDPAADVESLRTMARQVLASGEEQERLVEALLTLAVSERGLEQREPIDLGAIASAAVAARRSEALARRITVEAALEPAGTLGSDRLISRLLGNLIDNGLRYNHEGGTVVVSTAMWMTEDGQRSVVRVVNTGPIVPSEDLERLLLPFQRIEGGRTAKVGHGIGLSIVAAVAHTHDGTIVLAAPTTGGLDVTVSFPVARETVISALVDTVDLVVSRSPNQPQPTGTVQNADSYDL